MIIIIIIDKPGSSDFFNAFYFYFDKLSVKTL